MKKIVTLFAPFLFGLCAFIVLLSFSLKNTQIADLHYYVGLVWHAPLYLIVLSALFGGVIIGLITCIPLILQQRKRLSLLTTKNQ